MNIKLVRNAMFITVIIMTLSVMGKTSAHEARSTQGMCERRNITQVVLEHPHP